MDINIKNKLINSENLSSLLIVECKQRLDDYIFNNVENEEFNDDYLLIKKKFLGNIDFIAELINVKLFSQKIGFDFLDIMYRKFSPTNFTMIYNLYVKQPNYYNMYTLVLTLSSIIRTHFNDNIFSNEVNKIFNSFSTLFIIYLVLSVLLEVVIFFILNFGIISDVRKTNKLLVEFISSLKF